LQAKVKKLYPIDLILAHEELNGYFRKALMQNSNQQSCILEVEWEQDSTRLLVQITKTPVTIALLLYYDYCSTINKHTHSDIHH